MLLKNRTTLTQYLIEHRRHRPHATGDFNELMLQIALACKGIARKVAHGSLRGALGHEEGINIQGEAQKAIDVYANEVFMRTTEWTGVIAGMASEDMEKPYMVPAEHPRGKYLLLFDSLDGSSNIDTNVAVGSIFSVLRLPERDTVATEAGFLQPGAAQVAAGYAIYGPSTMLVLTVGTGVHAFTLDPGLGEFFLTRSSIRIPRAATEFAINASNRRFWEPAVQRYIDECLAGPTGPRRKDFNMRWVASLVAETHRILTRGGVFLYPRDSKDPAKPGRLRLLFEANPMAFLIEQAGGLAGTGRARMLDAVPRSLHQGVPFIFGAAEEVERIEEYHRENNDRADDSPLYGTRGLFRASIG